jgi:hypothetical protein
MFRNIIIAASCAALLTVPAIAMTTQTAPKSSMATSQTDNSTVHHRHHIAMKSANRGDREVNALNALEAAGYRQFNNLHASGRNFVATAQKAGKSYDVTVNPSGGIQTSNT